MDMGKLIAAVHKRGPLWDQKDKNHHNRFVLDKLWNEVAHEFNTTRDVPRNKWKALRDKFRKEITGNDPARHSDNQTRENTGFKSDWPYFQKLLFLKNQFTLGKDTEHFKNCDPAPAFSEINHKEVETEDMKLEILAEAQGSSSNSVLSSASRYFVDPALFQDDTASPPPRKKIRSSDVLSQASLNNDFNKSEDDEELNFFKSIIPTVRTLSPLNKMSFRMEVLRSLQTYMLKEKEASRFPQTAKNEPNDN